MTNAIGSSESSTNEIPSDEISLAESRSRVSFLKRRSNVKDSAETSTTEINSEQISPSETSDSRSITNTGWVRDINRHQLMAKHLHRECIRNNWADQNTTTACVALRTFQGEYTLFPLNETGDETFAMAVKGLNIEVLHFFIRP